LEPDSNFLYPLDEFYEQSGLPAPVILRIAGQEMPEPYRSLLVHDRDMTPTLEGAYRRSIQLRVLNYSLLGDVFSREVVLILEGDAKPAAFGAIKIDLKYFPAEARRLVLERKQPLGTILRTQGIAHESHPDAYLQVTADAIIENALGLSGPRLLYGRRNIIVDAAQHTLAQVVEILPPWNGISVVTP
jgi:chorismate-pyruvate lyase